MRLTSFEAIAEALERAAVRYLVVGGLAVNAHGFLRFTKDVDLVIQLQTDNVRRAMAALATLGYRPAIPVSVEQFVDAEYLRAVIKPLREGLPVRFVSIPTLIDMKERAGRPQDRIDAEHLRLRIADDE